MKLPSVKWAIAAVTVATASLATEARARIGCPAASSLGIEAVIDA